MSEPDTTDWRQVEQAARQAQRHDIVGKGQPLRDGANEQALKRQAVDTQGISRAPGLTLEPDALLVELEAERLAVIHTLCQPGNRPGDGTLRSVNQWRLARVQGCIQAVREAGGSEPLEAQVAALVSAIGDAVRCWSEEDLSEAAVEEIEAGFALRIWQLLGRRP